MEPLEELCSESFDRGSVSEVIRPAARLNESAARTVLVELALRDVRDGGHWHATPSLWQRFDTPWTLPDGPGRACLIGGIQVAYGTPTTYEITIYRVTVTAYGASAGWTVETLCDEALGLAALTLSTCPRVALTAPPRPFRLR